MCGAYEKCTNAERRMRGIALNVLHHCLVTELIGSVPQFVELGEPVVGKLCDRSSHRLMKLQEEGAALVTVEILKSMCTHVSPVRI